MAYLLGIDVGTSACKLSVFDYEGNAVAETAAAYPTEYPHPGWAQQNPDLWWDGICAALRELFRKFSFLAPNIDGIGISGQSWSAIPVDKNGSVLAPTPIWLDTRSEKQCREAEAKVGPGRIFDVAGNMLKPQYTTGKVLWYRQELPEVFEKTEKILQSNSFIAYRLTGNFTMDHSQGYAFHCFDMRQKCWNSELAKELGIPEHFLPDLVESRAVVGTVTPEAAALTGLLAGTPVIAGGLDAACGTLGAGVYLPGQTQEQGGQAGGMSICLKDYIADPSLILSPHVTGDTWLLQGGTTGGGGTLRWFETQLSGAERCQSEEQHRPVFDILNEEAASIAPGCEGVIFLPYMSGERSPIWNPDAKGVFYGLDFSKTRQHMLRAVMEGVAYSLRHNLEVAEQAGASVGTLYSMGGSAKSYVWTQLKSDITQKTILVAGTGNASALGAAMLAGVGTGVYRNFEDAVAKTVHLQRSHKPSPASIETYDKTYRLYRQLYENLKTLMNGDI